MRLSRYLALVFLLCPLFAYGQGMQIKDVATKLVNGVYVPAIGASVTVCTSAGSGTPCTPLATIYTDKALTQTSANPIVIGTSSNSDTLGNFNFYVSPSVYVATITGSGLTSRSTTYQVACPTDGNCAFTGNNTFNGQLTAPNPCSIDGLIYVTTAGCYTTINAAVAALPSTGGTIYLPPGIILPTGGTVTISQPNTVIIGAGSSRSGSIGAPGGTVIRGGSSANPVIIVTAAAWNVRLYHLQIDNEQSPNSATMGIQLIGGVFHFTAEDVSFGQTQKFTTAGVQSTTAAISAFLVFRDCFFNGAAPINMDIDRANGLILDHTTMVGNANTTTGNLRIGNTTLTSGTWIGNGSDLELQSNSGNTAFDISLINTANTVIRDSFIETVIDAVVGSEGQLAILMGNSATHQVVIEGNYFQGNAHTNFSINTQNSPSNIFINQNEFTGYLSAAFNPSSGQTHATIGDNFYTGGTPVGAFNNTQQWVDSSGQTNFGKPVLLNGATSGAVTLAVPAAAGSNTASFPANTGTVSELNLAQSYTANQNFPGNTAALTSDWTCGTAGTVSSCVAATIIGSGGGVPLTFTLPLIAQSYILECDGVVGQATAATANQWNLLTATNGATNVTASYSMATAATASAFGAVTDQASTTTTFQIAPSWTLGGTATKMPFHIWAKIEGASASGTVVSLQLVAPTVGDLVTIYRGASCRVF